MGKSKNIGRLLFWFKDNDTEMYEYTKRFTPLAMLLARLINENYEGKKITFLNINFNTQSTFEHFEKLKLGFTNSYGGHVKHDAIFSRMEFDIKSLFDQKRYLWDLAFKTMKTISEDTKNCDLKSSAEIAYKKGLEIDLNENYIIIHESFNINEKLINVELWAEFNIDIVSARLKISNDKKLIFDQVIDSSKPDTEFFYEMFKKIVLDSKGQIVLKGHFEVEYLPLMIDLKDKI